MRTVGSRTRTCWSQVRRPNHYIVHYQATSVGHYDREERHVRYVFATRNTSQQAVETRQGRIQDVFGGPGRAPKALELRRRRRRMGVAWTPLHFHNA